MLEIYPLSAYEELNNFFPNIYVTIILSERIKIILKYSLIEKIFQQYFQSIIFSRREEKKRGTIRKFEMETRQSPSSAPWN